MIKNERKRERWTERDMETETQREIKQTVPMVLLPWPVD